MAERDLMNKTIVRRGKIKDQGNDFLFWQSQPYEKRLATIEQIRNEYNSWKYADRQGLQRVYRVVKRQQR